MPGRRNAQRRTQALAPSSSSLSSAPDDSEFAADDSDTTAPAVRNVRETHAPEQQEVTQSLNTASNKRRLDSKKLSPVKRVKKSVNSATTNSTEPLGEQGQDLARLSRTRATKSRDKAETDVFEEQQVALPRGRRRTETDKAAHVAKKEEEDEDFQTTADTLTTKSVKGTKRIKKELEDGRESNTQRVRNTQQEEVVENEHKENDKPKPPKRKRKTKEEKEAEAMPLAGRAVGLKLFIGAHVSAAKGVHNSITNCVHIGGNAFALFLKSQRKWESPPLQEEHVSQFKSFCKDHKFDAERHIVPHGSYLVNLAQADTAKAKQAYESFLDDVKRCEALGIKLYNFHPGNTGPSPRPEAIARIAGQLNRVHQNSSGVVTLLETMAGGGNVIGSTFEDLRDIIALIDDKSRVGVCLDTCHIFAAGYEVRDKTAFEGTMSSFADIIGLKYLRAVHLNDSKAPFGSHRDLHANIGTGFLGLRSFHYIMNSPLFHNMPMVLETPISAKDSSGKEIEDKGIWAREIKTLESLIDMDMDGNEFRDMEERLWKSGSDERARIQAQVDKKLEKDKLKAVKSSKAGKSKPVARRKTAKQQAESSDSELSPNDSSEN